LTAISDTNVQELEKMSILHLVFGNFKSIFLVFVLVITLLNSSFGQSKPDYNMSLSNGIKINDNTIEFDVLIKGANTNFNLTSYQCSFLFNHEIANGGELTFTYIDGSSQLSNLPTFGIGINNFDNESKLTFASMAGSDQVNQSDIIVGRFRLTNTVAFSNVDPNISWNFEGFVATILTGDNFQDITTPVFHTSNLKLDANSPSPTVPTEHQLSQNYPNPFNPNTNIRFALKSESNVKLVVYNLLGEMIKELVNNKIAAGNHEYTFNSDDLPSGTYLYRLEANNQTIGVKKMTLVK
jgi:hypothetical protein